MATTKARVIAANKREGANFEAIFRGRAGVDGFKALRNELSFRWGPGGRVIPVRADLDFRVLNPKGSVLFADCKRVAGAYFLAARMEKHQVARALVYNAYRVRAGFVVYFGSCEKVVFYSGNQIARAASGTRFTPNSGLYLGRLVDFSLAPIFEAEP